MKRISVIVGSLRSGSFSRNVARALVERAEARSILCEFVDIGDLPLYNEDLDGASPPEAWTRFRSIVKRADGILFVTPEYNRSIPGGLKNAIDVGSRPPKKSVFDGMPAAVVSVTPYRLGAFGANHALRQTFVFLNMPALQQPEMYVSNAKDVVTEQGKVKDAEFGKLLDEFVESFIRWIDRVGRAEASATAE